MGIRSKLNPVHSLVLGTSDVSPLDMASAFSTFANRGIHNDPEYISRIEQVADDGNVTILEQAHPSGERVLDESIADQVTYAMRGVVTNGTGHAANFGKPEAGKTGTTQNHRDAWFVGFTPRLTTAVWMGYPNSPGQPPKNMLDVHGIKVTGGSLPTTIWTKFMKAATAGKDQGSFVSPRSFPGKVLNDQLVLSDSSTTSTSSSTTLPDGASTSTSSTLPGGITLPSTSTTTPKPTTTSTLPACPPGPAPPQGWPPAVCRDV
jgi:penicillin-binding protein 1A